MTSIDEINTEPHGQKISIITGLDQNTLNINSINYVQVLLYLCRPETKLEKSILRCFIPSKSREKSSNLYNLQKRANMSNRASSVDM
jgi:hypothetical protein